LYDGYPNKNKKPNKNIKQNYNNGIHTVRITHTAEVNE